MKSFFYILFFISILKSSYSQNSSLSVERFAILDFEILGNDDDIKTYKWMQTGFPESLSDAFSRLKQFSIVERSQIAKIINEQKFQATNAIDTTSIVKTGKLLGVNKVLIGSCQLWTGHILINMRIVNVETGEVSAIDHLPIITPIDSILYLQQRLCAVVLKQFKIQGTEQDLKEIEIVTSKSTKSLKAYEFLNKGVSLYNNGQYEEAIDMYNIALASDGKYSKAYYRRGITNYALKEYEKAASDFSHSDKYLKKDSIFILMSDAYFKQGLYKKAQEFLKKAQKINPGNKNVKKLLLKFENIELVDNKISSTTNAQYETVYEYINGVAKVKLNNKYGFIDTSNNIVIPIVFKEIKKFTKGLAPAKIDSKWGYINEKGAFVIEPNYSEASTFDKYGTAKVTIKEEVGVIDIKGTVIVPIEFISINGHYYFESEWESDDLMTVVKYRNKIKFTYNYGVYDRNGKEIIPLIYDQIQLSKTHYSNGSVVISPYIRASLDEKWGLINSKNELIIPFKYAKSDCIGDFSKGFAAVKINERWGFVNSKGLEIIPTKYDRVKNYSGNHFEVKLKGKWGILDTNNVVILPCIYDQLSLSENGYWCAKKDNLFGIVDTNKTELTPFTYDKLEYLEDGFWAAKKGSLWGVVDSKNNVTCDFKFDAMGSETENNSTVIMSNKRIVICVKQNGKKFWIDEKGKCLMDCK